MVSVCFYFQVHQPYRMRRYQVFDIGMSDDYFDKEKNREVLNKVAKKCYIPTNELMLKLIKRHKGKFRISYSITGVALEQFEKYCPHVIETFKRLADTGQVEFLGETYYHSLSYLYSKKEFKEQIKLHEDKMKELFNQKPKVFRNTELIFNNELANLIQQMGYKGILAEGADHVLDWRSPNYLYTAATAPDIKLMLKNYKLSDDIAFRFSNKTWNEYPLNVEKYVKWMNSVNGNGEVINLFMDYETFGEHQWEDTGIFKFMERLPAEVLKHPHNEFLTPSEAIDKYPSRGELDIHVPVSWADLERDTSAWLGNKMQQSSIRRLYEIEEKVKQKAKDTGNLKLIQDWRRLTTSDHFYYMCTKWFNDGDVHKYFNPYDSPYDSFINFMNILNDIMIRINEKDGTDRDSSKVFTNMIGGTMQSTE